MMVWMTPNPGIKCSKNKYSVVDVYEGDLASDGPNAGQRVVNGWKDFGLPWSYKPVDLSQRITEIGPFPDRSSVTGQRITVSIKRCKSASHLTLCLS